MRLLLYGFGPYHHFRQNITERILRGLPTQKGLKKVVFPVRFHKGQFIKAVKDAKPDVIVGLGQCSRGQRLRIETKAVNRRRKDQRTKSRPIVPGGKPTLLTNLMLDCGGEARSSGDAGDYVCNYSMYVILDYLRQHQLNVRFGFIHIPHLYNSRRAIRFLTKVIRRAMLVTQTPRQIKTKS
jgi:pyroglutamyl-peptidase